MSGRCNRFVLGLLTIAALRSTAAAAVRQEASGPDMILRAAAGRTVDELVAALTSFGPPAYAPLFRLHLAGGWAEDSEVMPLAAHAEQAVLQALCALHATSFRAALPELEPLWGDARARIAALELVAAAGDEGDLPFAFALAIAGRNDAEPPNAVPRDVRRAVGDTLRTLLVRHGEGTRRVLRGDFAGTPPELAATIVAAIADSGREDDVHLLTRLLGRRAALDPFLLREIARAARALPRPLPEPVLAEVRGYYHSGSATSRAIALRVGGQLGDEGALPTWIELLASPEPLLADAALDALRACTGRGFSGNPRAWRTWLEVEQEWWRERADDLSREACDGTPAAASAALQQIARRTIGRHELARRLACAVRRSETELAVLACHVLGELDSPAAFPALIEALATADVRVRDAAQASLERLSGFSAAPLPDAWALALGLERTTH